MSATKQNHFWQSPFRTVLLSGFVAGCLDMTTAIVVYAVIKEKTTAEKLLRYIASSIFKDKANTGGSEMMVYGMIIHFLIAYTFAILYFFLYPRIAVLRKQPIISAIVYGSFVWVVMNIIMVPLVFSRPYAYTTLESLLTSLIILIIMIGLPVSLITPKYYAARNNTPG